MWRSHRFKCQTHSLKQDNIVIQWTVPISISTIFLLPRQSQQKQNTDTAQSHKDITPERADHAPFPGDNLFFPFHVASPPKYPQRKTPSFFHIYIHPIYIYIPPKHPAPLETLHLILRDVVTGMAGPLCLSFDPPWLDMGRGLWIFIRIRFSEESCHKTRGGGTRGGGIALVDAFSVKVICVP